MRGQPFTFLCRWLIHSGLLLSCITTLGQNLKCRNIPTGQPIVLDTVLIEQGSIFTSSTYTFDDTAQVIEVDGTMDSVEVCYRILSSLITQEFKKRELSLYDPAIQKQPREISATPIAKEELFEFGGIEKYGAITRGVSFGNRQSVFVNSSLNLQMNGEVADNLYVSAVITDQNIPYQPEGNTQQIRDFDNVFIKLYNDNIAITAGDIVLSNPVAEDYFLKYYKNVQGLQFTYHEKEGKWKNESTVSAALAKGKFASILVPAVEGLSGPYRLRGPNGERFIIVLANSERVFLDGKLMERGFDQDYVIDYNLGEVTFNNHILITQFSRIRIDFEYAEQFYSRTNLSVAQKISSEKVSFHTGFYRERDNPTTNFGFSLNQQDVDLLQSIGDRSDQAFVAGFDSVQFDENRILYAKKDTLDSDGRSQTIFEFSTNAEKELFGATFSDVGQGNGNYVLSQSASNGRIYQWVSPQNGVRQGRYEPGAFIPLPNSRRMLNVGSEILLGKYEKAFSEITFSNTDRNLYSSLDDFDNQGTAVYAGVSSEGRESFVSGYNWSSALSVEYDSRDFTFIDRYRSIEFDRNWDINADTIENTRDLIVQLETSLVKDPFNQTKASINHRKREGELTGWQQSLRFNQELGKWRLLSDHSYLTNRQGELGSSWSRSKSDLSYRKYKIVPGYIFELDENELSRGDSIVSTRMNFLAHEAYLTSGDSLQGQFRLSFQLRKDRRPLRGEIQQFLEAQKLQLNYAKSGERSNLLLDLNYRSTKDREDPTKDMEIISGRMNWWGSYLNKSLTQNLSFSTGNSRELSREFVYLPVNNGEGTHTWRDQNEDGVQDLNEFFEAINPDERNYVKIFTPTDDYVTSFQTFYVHTIDARMPVSWRKQGGAKAFFAKFSLNTNLNINYRTTAGDFNSRLNPFVLNTDDPTLLSARDLRRLTLFYNRNRRGLAGDIALQTTDNKQLLTQGFEIKERSEWISNIKLDLSDEYTFRVTSSLGELSNRSDFLSSRNLKILNQKYEPQLIWQPSTNLRLIGSYERERKQNEFLETSNEFSVIQRYTGELTWNKVGKGSLRSSISWVNIDFQGDPTTYLAYLLLDALQPGINQTWQVNWQQKLSKGMQLSLHYNGRKSEAASAIHTGSVQVTAFF